MSNQSTNGKHNDFDGKTVTEQDANTTDVSVSPSINGAIKDLSLLKESFGEPMLSLLDDIQSDLTMIVESRDHARSCLPGSAHPVDSAMSQIDKIARIAEKIKDVKLGELYATIGSIYQIVYAGLDAANSANIKCAISLNERISFTKRVQALEVAVEKLALNQNTVDAGTQDNDTVESQENQPVSGLADGRS